MTIRPFALSGISNYSLSMSHPKLSIIIPTLNEEARLPLLLADLNSQKGLDFEIIVSDGGSTDGTRCVAKDFFAKVPVAGLILCGQPNRGRQLNTAIRAASGEWLLLLHADSRIPAATDLNRAIEFLENLQAINPDSHVAGHFHLSFDVERDRKDLSYVFYEAKSWSERVGCIHGDQGFLLNRSALHSAGLFREDLPVMEDTWFAESFRSHGRWYLLPGSIQTSARRFETEGLFERQLLNALLMNFLFIGWQDFFTHAPGVYRVQSDANCLDLLPFFRLIENLLKPLTFRKRLSLWFATGRFVQAQCWQIGLFLDCRKALIRGQRPNGVDQTWIKRFDLWFYPVTNHVVGHLITAGLVRIWFAIMLLRLQHRAGKE
ncbi:MAG: TIGR04283 family arsenosugar biosynthesis glycosyltransferase [Deltaproteobacteria bacterium]|jgi:rSAM/selenodomain-associated transferase 2|nr:TIGR04283 family arsenosugar biosynthesis glycosyltransferase [Deltaproteobacteria bacterium]